MSVACVADVVEALERSQILKPEQLEAVRRALKLRNPEPRSLCRELQRRGWLTPFQIHLIARGDARHLVLGQYVLLNRLGHGGMGQVFKARHRVMQRIVAIKILRKEVLDRHPNAIQRFEREVQAVAQVSHPNIVHAFDADQFGQMHFLVMEYVDGVNLSQLLHETGPLPVAQACDYIRQAAEGLQHVHERGMVHRDIKPSNLLIARAGKQAVRRAGASPWGTLKILDLGLARLSMAAGEATGEVTVDGSVMGSADYMAPEQARNSHLVDIRADLYSLGCTFYKLLTGDVPFPRASYTEKLLKHQLHNPPPVDLRRTDIPVEVAAIVHKLLAKSPDDRYQVPRDLAIALTSLNLPETAACDYLPSAFSNGDEGASSTCWAQITAASSPKPTQRRRRRQPSDEAGRRALAIAIAGLLLVVATFLFVLWANSLEEETNGSNVHQQRSGQPLERICHAKLMAPSPAIC